MTSLLVPPNRQPNAVPLDLTSLTVLPEPMTIEQFYEFCRCHPELRIERSPYVAWISADRWDSLTEDQRESFTEIAPDFVIELRSSSDTLKALKEKMDEYMANGVRMGLLLDRKNRTVYLYRPGQVPEVLKNPERVSCEPDLPGFQLNLSRIW